MIANDVTHSLRIKEYYYMVLRHKFVFTVMLVFSLCVAILLTFVLPKAFQAETLLLIEEEGILNPLISGLAISPSVTARLKTLREELLSWQRLTLLIEKLGLDKNIKNPLEYEKLIKTLRDHILIQMKGMQFQLISISFEGPDPKKAQEVVQTLADIIVDGNLTSMKVETKGAIQFIEEQLELYRRKLEESETRLREFQEVYNSTLPLATQMNEQLVNLKLELGKLLIDNTEEHPRVVQTKKLIQEIEKQRNQQMIKAKDAGFEISPQEYANLVTSVPRQQQYLQKLQRDYEVNNQIYSQLLQRLETAKISQTLEQSEKGAKFRVLEPARLPLQPVKPNKLLILIGGLLIGIGLGLAFIYILELNNNSLRHVDEARELLELPILGTIGTILPEELLTQEKFEEELRVHI